MSAPETIYLQYVEGDDDTWRDTTWCDERINDDDIVYTRSNTCEWREAKEMRDPNRWWGTSCQEGWAIPKTSSHNFTYCPFCGGRVEIADSDAGAVSA